MDEKMALGKMVAPGMKRPSIMLGGICQIHITRACDKNCLSCTQLSNMAGRPVMMSPEQFRVAAESLRDYFGVVGCFGGNPCLHPQFDEICRIMRGVIPFERRGIWTNNIRGKGAVCRITFNAARSNMNVHMDQKAYDEFLRDWPESRPFVKGLKEDSRHSPPFVALQDVVQDERERWLLISKCDINTYWSSLIGVFRGELRAYFCEVAYSQSILHEADPDWPDIGIKVEPGWWRKSMEDFKDQARWACHRCGIPLRSKGQLAVSDPDASEQVSKTHADAFRPKDKTRRVELVLVREQLQEGYLPKATDYIQNSKK